MRIAALLDLGFSLFDLGIAISFNPAHAHFQAVSSFSWAARLKSSVVFGTALYMHRLHETKFGTFFPVVHACVP